MYGGGTGDQCVGLTTLSRSYVDCLEIMGALRTCPALPLLLNCKIKEHAVFIYLYKIGEVK
jgi:hypothetical protein